MRGEGGGRRAGRGTGKGACVERAGGGEGEKIGGGRLVEKVWRMGGAGGERGGVRVSRKAR